MATKQSNKPKRVLMYRLGSLGDMVVALPAFHLVAKVFPDAERRLLTSFPPNSKAPASSEVLKNTGLVHGYLRYNYNTRNLLELLRLWSQLLRWRPELLIYMSGQAPLAVVRRNAWFFRLCGISSFVGVPINYDMQRCRLISATEHAPHTAAPIYEHESSRLLRNLSALGNLSLDSPASWDLHLTQMEVSKAKQALLPLQQSPFFCVCLGTKNQANDWGFSNWQSLLKELQLRFPTYGLVVLGAEIEKHVSEVLVQSWRAQGGHTALNLCGLLSPRESAVVIRESAVFVGHDSGPTHLAAAVQTPVVAIYGGRNPLGIWFPYGSNHTIIYHNVDCAGCLLSTCITERKKCILSITVGEVCAAVSNVLAHQTD